MVFCLRSGFALLYLDHDVPELWQSGFLPMVKHCKVTEPSLCQRLPNSDISREAQGDGCGSERGFFFLATIIPVDSPGFPCGCAAAAAAVVGIHEGRFLTLDLQPYKSKSIISANKLALAYHQV